MPEGYVQFTWGPGGVLYDGATTYTPGLGQRQGISASRFSHSDWVGSTRYLSENTGLTFPTALRFDAFGQRTALAGPTYPTPYQFAGGWGYETEYSDATEPYLGLSYVEQRYYEPATGRFISPDPAGFESGLNLFAYCGNDPVNNVDPSGQVFETLWDFGVVLWDIGSLTYDAVTGAPRYVVGLDVTALGLDSGALVIPFVPGGSGRVVRAVGIARAGVRAVERVRVAEGVAARARLVGRVGGAAARATAMAAKACGNGGENSAARRGREAHEAFKEKVKAKGGEWRSEPQDLINPATGRKVVPDAVTPKGRPLELKPRTASGRSVGKRQLRVYEGVLGKRGRVLYYDP